MIHRHMPVYHGAALSTTQYAAWRQGLVLNEARDYYLSAPMQ